jgi:hypothetical protein
MIRNPVLLFAALAVGIPCPAQCGFHVEPATATHWYREQGWQLPGLNDAKRIAPLRLEVNGAEKAWPAGISVSAIIHDDGYDVQFPEAVFDEDGSSKKMLAATFELKWMFRWEFEGKPYAYSYELWPHDVGCSESIDIIDDRGDGKFRLMTSPGHASFGQHAVPPPVPERFISPKT